MSGLEKFQATEAWRTNLKKFLLMDRKPETIKNTTAIAETPRYSLDISDELKDIIQKRKNKSKEIREKETYRTEMEHDKDNPAAYLFHGNDTLVGLLENHKNSDESFEALERMCDKTASDPNSTLFQYLNSDNKDEILSAVKNRSTDAKNYENIEFDSDNLLAKMVDCTMLDDIEAPSRMWENTITCETNFKTSPVKMVGLMRPSTIFEEAVDDSSVTDTSSHLSFQTTAKSNTSGISTSVYDTAYDSTQSSSESNKLIDIDVDELVFSSIAKSRVQSPDYKLLKSETSKEIAESSIEKENEMDDESIDLINLEDTFANSPVLENTLQLQHHCNDNRNLDETIIEILSDDENVNETHSPHSKDHSSIIFDNKENVCENKSNDTKSLQFNDTMEEVEYMMKKGMEYMAAQVGNTVKNVDSKPIEFEMILDSTKSMCSPKAFKDKPNIPAKTSPVCTSYSYNVTEKITSISKLKSTKNCQLFEKKTFPKFFSEKKDQLGHPRQKELSSNKQFSHIISPIGTYMKKTATAPLMSSIKSKTNKTEVLNSTVFRELEYESQIKESSAIVQQSDCLPKLPGLSSSHRVLPKKAYISSNLKHIVDERTPITIPGGKSIQKYLEDVMMPAVLRHDGKLKIQNSNALQVPSSIPSELPLKQSENVLNTPRRINASLADLSLMSGDVSMYTIKDAQKF